MYKPEEFLPIVKRLMERYTSKESSSVTYETAGMLGDAVLYCVEEWMRECKGELPEGHLDLKFIYSKGYEKVVQKVVKARALYDGILDGFEDYGCRNYRDTILKGMPGFFLCYNPEFNPMNHILTLDYPALRQDDTACGIDLIYQYLECISIESELLGLFPVDCVRKLVNGYQKHFGIPYMENLCDLVLLQAIGCIMADQPVSQLVIDEVGLEKILFQIKGEKAEQIEKELKGYLRILTSRIDDQRAGPYFMGQAREYAVRIGNGLKYGGIDEVFSVD